MKNISARGSCFNRLSPLGAVLVLLLLISAGVAAEPPVLSDTQREKLKNGDTIQLSRRPDETLKIDRRFVTVAALVTADRDLVFSVVNDKENAEDFVDGVLESEVVKRDGNTLLVNQRTVVGGPKGSYAYTLLHTLYPPERSDFEYVSGEMKDVEGTWWFFPGEDAGTCLLVYSLHIDAGFFAPQVIVKSGMKKSMPGTIKSIVDEVTRRQPGN